MYIQIIKFDSWVPYGTTRQNLKKGSEKTQKKVKKCKKTTKTKLCLSKKDLNDPNRSSLTHQRRNTKNTFHTEPPSW